MDSPHSDDERSQEAGAGDSLLSKKMKLLIIMLSLVLIILLLPLASNHGLPLLKPMGISMLQRLWDAMRFIAMTAAISVGIISTSSQRNEKGSDRSAHLRSQSSTRRSSFPIASSSRESINPRTINNFDMNRSDPPDPSVDRDVNDILYQESRVKEMRNLQKMKGKEMMDDFATAAASSSSAAPSHSARREEEIYDLGSPSKQVHSRWAPSQEENYEKQRQTNSRRRLSASDAWSFASRIDEEIEEEDNIARASDGFPNSDKSLRDSRVGLQKKYSPIDDKGLMSNKEIKIADRSFMNVYASMTDDNYAELRMRKAAMSRLTDEIHDANGKGHRRSSSVDRRRPIHYDDQGPDRPGLKQILMDVSKDRAFNGKRSNLSSATKMSPNVHDQTDRPHSMQASISSTQIANTSVQQSMKASVQHRTETETLPSDSKRIEKHESDANNIGSHQVVHRKQQEAIKMGNNQIFKKPADTAKMSLNEMVQSKPDGVIKMGLNQTPNQNIRQTQDDAVKGPNQRMQADMRTNQIRQKQDDDVKSPNQRMHTDYMRSNRMVQRQDDYRSKVGNVQIKQDVHQAKVGINQTLQKRADAKMAFAPTLQKADARSTGSDPIAQMQLHGDAKMGSIVSEGVQMQRQSNDAKGPAQRLGDPYKEDFQSTLQKANTPSRSQLLLQSSKHSRSALNLEQLERVGNTLHARPPAGPSTKRKKSFSCDFGDGYSPDWLWELEPPPPPGFIDQQNAITSPAEANESRSLSTPPNTESDNVQSLLPWRWPSVPIDISAYPRAASPVSPPLDAPAHASFGPSPSSVNRRADEFISNFTTKLIKQRQESLERQRRYG